MDCGFSSLCFTISFFWHNLSTTFASFGLCWQLLLLKFFQVLISNLDISKKFSFILERNHDCNYICFQVEFLFLILQENIL
ncbi:hypothetical protein NC653_033847 [Populus alba x Populus x berolinensis]|uniref:Uncharacterized protein n=1 Tax=Populus alba x Populus x berolinensis TaxID=444605 RepID=A0AAD6LV01_9ROSI|nr:hypothetical protein NC653_033847 [Populus alba x Populus x berolinensis]